MYLGMPGRQTPWLIASRGVFSFFSTARPGFVDLEGQMAMVGEGSETAEGAMFAGALWLLDRYGIDERMSTRVM